MFNEKTNTELRNEILEVLNHSNEPLSATKISQELGFCKNNSRVNTILNDLVGDNEISEDRQTHYTRFVKNDLNSEYDEDGFDSDGFNKDGYDEYGYDKDGYNLDGYDEDGYDPDGYDGDGFDADGYDKDGYDEDGYDKNGYNEDGYDEDGYDPDGYDEDGYDGDGYSRDDNEGEDSEGESPDEELLVTSKFRGSIDVDTTNDLRGFSITIKDGCLEYSKNGENYFAPSPSHRLMVINGSPYAFVDSPSATISAVHEFTKEAGIATCVIEDEITGKYIGGPNDFYDISAILFLTIKRHNKAGN